MKFYIASKLENHEQVTKLALALKAAGHIHTYDWTTHCSVKDEGEERIKTVAVDETKGVLNADFVIVVLPGGRGTHAELGVALGAGHKQVIICSTDESPFKSDDNTCAFYWNPEVLQTTGDVTDWLTVILALAKKWDDEQPVERGC